MKLVMLVIAFAVSVGRGQECASTAQEPPRPAPLRDLEGVEWNARNVEHLCNRAGFGATPAEIDAAVQMGSGAFFARLFSAGAEPVMSFPLTDVRYPNGMRRFHIGKPDEFEVRKHLTAIRERDHAQMVDFACWWIERMRLCEEPLRERTALFWHGHFATSIAKFKRSMDMATQIEFLRARALGTFRELVLGIIKDGAMLKYLDAAANPKLNPNANLARELLELFTLGVGHYTEKDVTEAARALTGWRADYGESAFLPELYDDTEKTILGVTGNIGLEQLVDILIAQEACAPLVAGKLIAYFEGREPSAERLEDYARFLREHDYHIGLCLERLFRDPEFYSDEVVGARIAGPLDFLVGASRRLGLEAPPRIVGSAARQLGQDLLNPPSVKGWTGGAAWITTSSLLERGNMAGLLLGLMPLEDALGIKSKDGPSECAPGTDTMMKKAESEGFQLAGAKPGQLTLRGFVLQRRMYVDPWTPTLDLRARIASSHAGTAAQIVDETCSALLAVDVSAESRAAMIEFLGGETAPVDDAMVATEAGASEATLRRLAHLILSLPEAQLH